ncbi:MAG: PmoA family protein [Microbacteriaceae bacterium]
MSTARVLLVGAHGFGSVHLERLEGLTGTAVLVGTVDPKGAPRAGIGATVPNWPDLDTALAAGAEPDVVIVATPTDTHAALAERALRVGAEVYLEKPPTATLAQYHHLLAVQRETGRAVQVGFQSLGSRALPVLAELGVPSSVSAVGRWIRRRAYWHRAAWAGKRVLNGAPVTDGVVTNPLAHAVATALRIAGARRAEDVARVETELLHANDIDADDTSTVRVTLSDGRRIGIALTLCAEELTAPAVDVRTTGTDARLWYTEDVVEIDGERRAYGRDNLFVELLAHRSDGAPLSSSLADAGAFMTVLEAVRTAPDPRPIDPAFVRVDGEGEDSYPVPERIDWWVRRAAESAALFSELRVPWAPLAPAGVSLPVRIRAVGDDGDDGAGEREVAVRDDGSTVTRTSSPRPFLHPLRTLGGTTVSEAHPWDHDWHLGLSFGVQHVVAAGRPSTNLWGGRTYTRERGYRWLEDHGRVVTEELAPLPGGYRSLARWEDAEGRVLMHEEVELRAAASAGSAWTFSLRWRLREGDEGPVRLGSPGTHGREGAGYGGLSWRLPRPLSAIVRTPDAEGEQAVHGRAAAWVSFAGEFPEGEATLALAAADAATAADPWFVRLADFPAIGSAVAFAKEAVVTADSPLERSYTGLVADGIRTADEVARLLSGR